MQVVGGAYWETCLRPERSLLRGPGVTAAMTLRALHQDVTLHTRIAESDEQEVQAIAASYAFTLRPVVTGPSVRFRYVTPLAIPHISPRLDAVQAPTLQLGGDDVLVYGMLDARPRVHARQAVYDPQSGWAPLRFREQLGGVAGRLAYVLNTTELRLLCGQGEPQDLARSLLAAENAAVVVVKRGLQGALVVQADRCDAVPSYRAGTSTHLIGSGDVFSAVFAAHWFAGEDATGSANRASRAVSHYVTSGQPEAVLSDHPVAQITPWSGTVYIAAPFFTLAERWQLDEVVTYLEEAGLLPKSPLHVVGRGSPKQIAEGDLVLLDACARVFAILDNRDPGTIFEVGHAIAMGKPVWAASTSNREAPPDLGDLRMILGSGVHVFDDVTAAIMDLAMTP